MKTDMHNHAVPESAMRLLSRNPSYGVTVDAGFHLSGSPEGAYTVEAPFRDPPAKLANLEEHGLEAAVVSVDPTFFWYDVNPDLGAAMSEAINEGLKELCAYSPNRLRWMATLPMQDPELAAGMLERQREAGCVGVEIGTHIVNRRLDEPAYEPFWAAAERLGVPVMIHPSYNEPHPGLQVFHLQNVIGNLLETTLTVERLICTGVLDRHPRASIVIVHSGGYFAWQAGRLKHARRVRAELASAPEDPWAYVGQIKFDCLTHDRQALAYLLSRIGPENVLMGTDLPCDMASAQPWEDLRAVTDEATALQVAGENIERVFGLAPAVTPQVSGEPR